MAESTPKKHSKKHASTSEGTGAGKKRRHSGHVLSEGGNDLASTTPDDVDDSQGVKKKRRRTEPADVRGEVTADTVATSTGPEPATDNGTDRTSSKEERKEEKRRRRKEERALAHAKAVKPEGAEEESTIAPGTVHGRQAATVDGDGEDATERRATSAVSVTPKTPHSATPRPGAGSSSKKSPFIRTTTSVLVPLACPALDSAIQGLCAEHLSPLLLTYYPPLKGILLSYSAPRLHSSPHHIPPYVAEPSNNTASPASPSDVEASWTAQATELALTADEYSTPFIWLSADCTLLRPRRGARMVGTVCVQNPSWLGLVCWNWFNAGIPARRLPKGWRWVDFVPADTQDGAQQQQQQNGEDGGGEDGVQGEAVTGGDEDEAAMAEEGCWVDENGVPVRGAVEFTLRDFEHQPNTERESGFVSFEGTLLNDEDDAKVDQALREDDSGKAPRNGFKHQRKGKRRAA